MARAEAMCMFTLIFSVSGYPYSVNVTDIKAYSALFHWKTTELLVEEFLIQCVGTQYYAIARDGRVHNTEMHVRSQFVPQGLSGITIGDLRPNYNYTCVIQETLPEGAQVFDGTLSKPVTFCSDYADPVAPKSPVIVKEDGLTRINLHKSFSTKYGPITGYRVQFHVIETSFLGDVAAIDREFTHPFGKFSPSSVEYAQVSPKALTFQIPYKGNYLPSYIQIGSDLLSGALKNGVLYRVITVAYTKCRDSSIAFTPSPPSNSFIAVGIDKFSSSARFLSDVRSEQLKIAIAAGVILPLVCLLYMCCIGLLLLCREQHLDKKYQPNQKSSLRRTVEYLKGKLLASWLTFLTLCIPFCGCNKRDKDYTYQRVPVHEHTAREPTTKQRNLSDSDDESIYAKAPNVLSKSGLTRSHSSNILYGSATDVRMHDTSRARSLSPKPSRQSTRIADHFDNNPRKDHNHRAHSNVNGQHYGRHSATHPSQHTITIQSPTSPSTEERKSSRPPKMPVHISKPQLFNQKSHKPSVTPYHHSPLTKAQYQRNHHSSHPKISPRLLHNNPAHRSSVPQKISSQRSPPSQKLFRHSAPHTMVRGSHHHGTHRNSDQSHVRSPQSHHSTRHNPIVDQHHRPSQLSVKSSHQSARHNDQQFRSPRLSQLSVKSSHQSARHNDQQFRSPRLSQLSVKSSHHRGPNQFQSQHDFKTVPRTTITPVASHEEANHQNKRQSSPNFEQTSGTQALQYTTSATGAFNTAEEFCDSRSDLLNNENLAGKSSEPMFVPRGYSAATVSSNKGLMTLPKHGGYEVISLSSSQMEECSEHSASALEVLH